MNVKAVHYKCGRVLSEYMTAEEIKNTYKSGRAETCILCGRPLHPSMRDEEWYEE